MPIRMSSSRRGSLASASPGKKRSESKDSSSKEKVANSMKLLKTWDFDIYKHMHGESVELAVSNSLKCSEDQYHSSQSPKKYSKMRRKETDRELLRISLTFSKA